MGSTKTENGSWWYYGEGAEGLRWYRMGPEDEQCRNCFGYEEGITVAEAMEYSTKRPLNTKEKAVAEAYRKWREANSPEEKAAAAKTLDKAQAALYDSRY